VLPTSMGHRRNADIVHRLAKCFSCLLFFGHNGILPRRMRSSYAAKIPSLR
jgi:hypothetical protein